MEISPTVRERVDAGADWANEYLPNWRSYIDPRWFDMAWEESCLLGQYHLARYGEANFARIVHALFGNDYDRAVELGFLAIDLDYAALTAAWLDKIKELNDNDEKKAT